MSTLKADTVTTKSDNTDLTITGGGTGVPNLETGFKVGGTAGVPVNNLRTGTDGELITWDASGDPATVAVGTATHILTSNGAGAAPTFQAAAGGGSWNIVGTAVASGSADLTITGRDSTYDSYAIAITDLVAARAGNSWWMRVGTSGGIDSGSDEYAYDCEYTSGSSYAHEWSAANTKMVIGNLAGCSTDVDDGFGAMFFLHRPLDGTTQPTISGSQVGFGSGGAGASAGFQGGKFMGARLADIDLDRIQILNGTGNIASGRMTIWGIAHA